MIIRPFLLEEAEAVKKFTDEQIGNGYYSIEELQENQKKSITSTGEIASFVLVNPSTQKICGLRLAFPPGRWSHGKGAALRPDLWSFPLEHAAYFQSLFIAKELQGQNWGPRLSIESLRVLKKAGAWGVITHSWKESPHNGSFRYLKKLGFKSLIEHPLYWFEVDYVCTRDGNPCRCTAIEMELVL